MRDKQLALLSLSALMVCGVIIFALVVNDKQPIRAESEEIAPTSYPNGVYFFPIIGDEYRRALGAFMAKHPELSCQYAGYEEKTLTSNDRGHTWLCRDVAIEAQDVTVP